jgi:DNA repair photolyase
MKDQVKVNYTYEEIYKSLFRKSSPESVIFGESSADIISQGRGFMEGFDLTMQLQVGCPGGCLFCYVPSGTRLTPVAIRGTHGEDWGFQVRNKKNVIFQLERHLEKENLADKTIYWSGVTDAYSTPPTVTRDLWKTLKNSKAELRPRRIVIQTRFRPDRDAELIAEYNQQTEAADGGPPVVVSFSLGTDRNDLIRAWERATPLYEHRMQAIKALCEAGIFVVPTLSPFGFWNDLDHTLKLLKTWDIQYITCLFFKENTQSANTPPHFLAYLRREYPFLLDQKWQDAQLRIMTSIFGMDRVIVGKAGFLSLSRPHEIVGLRHS